MACNVGVRLWPMLEVVWLNGESVAASGFYISLKQSITTFPFTDWIGSTTTATFLLSSCSNDYWVFTSTPESQQPKPGWEWYQPTTFSCLSVCFSISSILAWNSGSTASTETPEPDWGIANTSTTTVVNSSTNDPSIKPMTSSGTPALPCFSIFSKAKEEIIIFSESSGSLTFWLPLPPFYGFPSILWRLSKLIIN